MRKEEFLQNLRESLSGLPQNDVEERIAFYAEMIDDRMEEGLSEEEAVAAVGSVSDIVLQVVDEYPFPDLIKVRIRSRKKMSALTIVLLVLGSPVWASLLIAAAAVVFSLYVVLWSVIIVFWSVFVSLLASGVGVVAGGVVWMCVGYPLAGVAAVGTGLVCSGLSILSFYGCKAATIGALRLTKKVGLSIKRSLVKKEGAQ